MWRRQTKEQEHARVSDPEEVRRRWEEWEARWNPGEEERVARWLRMKAAGEAEEVRPFDTARDQVDWAVFEVEAGREVQPGHENGSEALPASLDALKAELAALRDERSEVTAALAAE